VGYLDLVGVDRNPRLAASFAGTPIRFVAREIEPTLELEGRYHTIVMNYVLEHLLDPARVLEHCRAHLLDGGQILVLTPNSASWCHRIFGSSWSGLHAPRHTHVFTPQSIERLLGKLGLRQVQTGQVIDPASWAFSFQNWVRSWSESDGVSRGTAWYGLASLPLWAPLAAAERVAGRSSSMVLSLRA
jgi:2-polyprenyl-3-methyl-5-hydroxy-6-metoxy-1,4-benzoquinol methylase